MGWTARSMAAAVLIASPMASAGGAAAGGSAACRADELELPGTAGCVRLGGVARAEAAAGGGTGRRIAPAAQGGTRAGTRAGASADLDARVPTAYGPLRAYLSAGTGGLGRR